jgi:hypothetical protein
MSKYKFSGRPDLGRIIDENPEAGAFLLSITGGVVLVIKAEEVELEAVGDIACNRVSWAGYVTPREAATPQEGWVEALPTGWWAVFPRRGYSAEVLREFHRAVLARRVKGARCTVEVLT